MSTHNNEETVNQDADIVIIGGGGAGLTAAVTARENGIRKILVVEKLKTLGGNTNFSGGPFAADSPTQKREGIIASKDELFRIAMKWAHWKINPKIVRTLINISGDTIRWFEEKGLEFECAPAFPGQKIITWHLTKDWQISSGGGREICKVLEKECRSLKVKIFTKTPAKKIMIDGKGKIAGVFVKHNNKELFIETKCIIIATGGYGGNRKLLKEYYPHYSDNLECVGLPHRGDGLVMAQEIGAATKGLGVVLLAGPHIPVSDRIKINSGSDIIRIPLMAVALEPDAVWINKEGERFIDESTGHNHFECSNAVIRQSDNVCYALLDSQLIQTKSEQGLYMGLGQFMIQQRSKMQGLERELFLKAKKGRVVISKSWEETAKRIKVDHKILETTILEYNEACDHGYDPVYIKARKFLKPLRTPPYYAIRCNSAILDTIGGIRINEHMQVINTKKDIIPGLYAAGVATGGWESDTYCLLLSGHASGFAMNSGRIAAENATKYIASIS